MKYGNLNIRPLENIQDGIQYIHIIHIIQYSRLLQLYMNFFIPALNESSWIIMEELAVMLACRVVAPKKNGGNFESS